MDKITMWEFTNPDDQSQPVWNDAKAAEKIGAYCVIGITEVHGEEVTNKYQIHGTIREVTRDGVLFELEGTRKGETWRGPPDERAFRIARNGEYRLRSTGEIIEDPDYEVAWTINSGPSSAN